MIETKQTNSIKDLDDIVQSKINEELREHLKSKRWRLTSGEFYKIKDKSGNIVPFIPNVFQLYYFKNKHNRNIILKARQLGFSTAIQIDYLDDALFNENFSIGIIAQDKKTARLIRKDKIEVALDNIPDRCKHYRTYDVSNSEEIQLGNKSSIYVSNTFRGGTLQRLHISEYGKICAKFPEKAEEIKTGAIESVAIDQQVTIESTAEGQEGDFYDKCEEFSQLLGKPHTPLDYKYFFFPRWLEKTYSYDSLSVLIPREYEEYFQKLYNEYGIELTTGQKNRYYLKARDLKDKMKREYPSVKQEAFEMSSEGAYYNSEMNVAYQQNRIVRVPYDPNLPVYTCWDIGGAGGGDDTSVRFFQIFGNEIRWIDYREGSGYSMLYVLQNIVAQKPYKYAKHIGPHDMRVHELMSGRTRLEIAKEAGFEFELVTSPSGAVSARHDIVRTLFPFFWIDSKNCFSGINKLKSYKRKRNESTGSFMDQPAKNGSQHSADSFGYGCQYISEYLLPKLKEKNTEQTTIKMHQSLRNM